LYAVWTAATYPVTYSTNGGSGSVSAQTKTYNVALALRTTRPTKTGYTFAGWAATPDAATPTYLPGASYTANETVVLYAVWTKR
jgi:uncharacterized repeat protein (TIGR02543 family)